MKGVGVVAALAAEARTLGSSKRRPDGISQLSDGTLLAISGMGATAAARAAQGLIDAGAEALLSFGLAGGLDPALAAGCIVIPNEVLSLDGERFETSRDWRESFRAAVGAHVLSSAGILLTSVLPIETIAGKTSAFRDTGAVAVDMESAAIARAASSRHLPFLAVRAIVDTAADELPRAVVSAGASGQVRILRLVRGLVRSPREVAGVMRLAQRYRTAMRSLTRAGRARRLTQFSTNVRVA